MSIVSEPAAKPAPQSTEGSGRHPVWVAAVAAAQVAATGLLAACAIAIAIWVVTPKVSVGWPEAVRVAVDVWAVAHGATLVLGHGTFDLAPLALIAVVVRLTWRGATRVREALYERERSVAKATHERDRARRMLRTYALASGAVFCAGYAVLGMMAAAVAGSTQARAPLGSVGLSCLTVAAVGFLAATYPLWRREGPRAVLAEHIVRAAGVALLGWLGLATIVLAGAIAFGWGRIAALQGALQAGVMGNIVLVLLQLMLLPTALTWAAAYVAGPGFTVGTGTQVTLGSTELGPLPALPLLGALPRPVEHPVLAWLVPVLVVLAGAAAGYWLRTRRPAQARPLPPIGDIALMALTVTLVAAVLAGLAGGSAGGGRMSEIGTHPLMLSVVVFLEMLVGGAIGMFAGPHLARGRLGRVAGRMGGLAARLGLAGAGARLGAAGDGVRRLGRRAAGEAGKASARVRDGVRGKVGRRGPRR